jgi:hypothetical protein
MDAVTREGEGLVEQIQRLNVDEGLPAPLWSPEIAARSKAEVLREDWKVSNVAEGSRKRFNRGKMPTPDPETWTTFKKNEVTLFYQAPSSPPIPSLKEIDEAHAKNRLNTRVQLHEACRMGNTLVKYSGNPNVLEVSKSCSRSSSAH